MLSKVPDIRKKALIEKVQPNFIYNRFDLMYGNDFDLYEFSAEDKKIYIPLHIRKSKARIGVWFAPLQGVDMGPVFSDIFFRYKNIKGIEFSHCLACVAGVVPGPHWHIDLQAGVDRFNTMLSSRTRYNVRWYEKKMRSSFKYEVREYAGLSNIPREVVETYLSLKARSHESKRMPWREYLKRFYVTDARVLYLDDAIAAVLFLSIVDKNVYLENLSYDEKFSKYSTGTILLYTTICELMRRGFIVLFLGGGNLEYKKRFNGLETMTCSGIVYNEQRISVFRRLKRKLLEGVGVLRPLRRE